MIYFALKLPSFCLRVLIELNPIIFPTWYAKSPALSNQGGYFDHNSAYFSSHTMSKKPYWKITPNFDFKEFWFDARERESEQIQLCQRAEKCCWWTFANLTNICRSRPSLFLFQYFTQKGSWSICSTFLLVLWGLCGRLENVFDIVSARYNVTTVADVYTLLPGSPQ